jgi:hypothetical protein
MARALFRVMVSAMARASTRVDLWLGLGVCLF